MKTHQFLLLIFILALALPLAAEQSDTKKTQQFRSLDSDNNGFITILEATGHNDILMRWAEVDKNTDGQLEISEFRAMEPGRQFVPPEDDNAPGLGAAPVDP